MRSLLATAVAVMLMNGGLHPAGAITFGSPDGDGHPYVGVLVAEWAVPGYKQRFCTGALIAPRVVVTAAHCFAELGVDEFWVSFDPIYRPGISTIYRGTPVTAAPPEDYRGVAGYAGQYGNSVGGPDTAVLHLDEAPPITPAHLPPVGLLDELDLHDESFTAVGYGRTRDGRGGPNDIEPNIDPDVRNVATQSFRSLQLSYVTLSQNPATGDGGTCFGDSGGPNLLGTSDVIVALTTLGDGACQSSSRTQRLDTQAAHMFLAGQGVPLP